MVCMNRYTVTAAISLVYALIVPLMMLLCALTP